MTSATIKLFFPRGDVKSLRTADISNWIGKAVAAPCTELDELLAREELDKAGVYILHWQRPSDQRPARLHRQGGGPAYGEWLRRMPGF